ncbi:MAG: pseudouridine synthase [Gammaproteobacteria bacterium]
MNLTEPHSPDAAFDLLHQDEALLLLHKPAGLLAVPGRGAEKQDCLSARVQAVFPQALTVHRLDMSTSGLMLMALDLATQRAVQRQFEQRSVSKGYIAVVEGRLQPESGEVDLPLCGDWPNRPRQRVDLQRGKPSLTRYRVLDYDAQADTSRLALEPVTGRTHQLRVHLQALGHAILGDPLYATAAVQARAARLMLHAESICLEHPLQRQKVCYHCPAPF